MHHLSRYAWFNMKVNIKNDAIGPGYVIASVFLPRFVINRPFHGLISSLVKLNGEGQGSTVALDSIVGGGR